MSQFIDEFCNDLANYNDNFLNVKQSTKMKVELIQKTTLTDTYYKINVEGEFYMTYSTYDEAVTAYDKIKSTIPREEVLLSKEI